MTTTTALAGRRVVHAVQHRGRRPSQHRRGLHPPRRGQRASRDRHRRVRTAPAVRRRTLRRASNGRTTSASSARTRAASSCAAGTIGSAQLLLLSGSALRSTCARIGIDVVADLPGVGENLHDHLLSPVIFGAEREVGPPSPGLPACQTHLFWRSRPGCPCPTSSRSTSWSRCTSRGWKAPENGFTLHGRDGAPAEPRLAAPHRADARGPGRARPERSRVRVGPREPRRRRRAVPADRRRGRTPRLGRRRALPGPDGRHVRGRARHTCARTRSPTTIRWARARWAPTRPPSSTPGSGCTASRVCGSRTRRSCRW